MVALEAAAAQPVAAFEVADPAFGAGPIELQAALGASRAGLAAAGDEDPLGGERRERFVGRATVEGAVEGDRARAEPEPLELRHGLGQ